MSESVSGGLRSVNENGLRQSPRSAQKSPRHPRLSLRSGQKVIDRLREMWPQKTDMELALRLSLSDRQCRKILADRANLTLAAFEALLKTDDGPEILEAFMGDDAPAWWQEVRREIEKRRLRRRLEALERGEA